MITQGMMIAHRYEIIGKIGAGGMSDVYKAKDTTLGRYVAIKVLNSEPKHLRLPAWNIRTL